VSSDWVLMRVLGNQWRLTNATGSDAWDVSVERHGTAPAGADRTVVRSYDRIANDESVEIRVNLGVRAVASERQGIRIEWVAVRDRGGRHVRNVWF
jgi:hypothetical protein